MSGDFPGGPMVKNLPANAGDWVRSLVWEDSTCLRALCLSGVTRDPMLCSKRSHAKEKTPHSEEE